MADVYFTWFGPPATANKTVTGIDAPVRPDIFGITRTADGPFANDPPPRFKFCCLKQYADRFRADLPDHIDIVPIEDQFASKTFTSLSLSRPDMNDLGLCVDFILRETIAFRGNRGLVVKQLAFCKDLWSLYVLWKLGGYHLDCGCFPHTSAKAVDLPEPDTFGAVGDTGGGGNYQHAKVRFQTGAMCACLSVGSRVLTGLVLANATTAHADPAKLNRNIDVWCLKSPAGHKAAKLALELYVQGWFATRATTGLSEDLQAQAMRELVVSAVATAITHSGLGDGCSGQTLWKSHLIDATFNPPVVPSMNLRKVGFASHR
jgi:hypothetical protein